MIIKTYILPQNKFLITPLHIGNELGKWIKCDEYHMYIMCNKILEHK